MVIFEIIAENLKFELDKLLKTNEAYKTDYYTCNRKKFLLTNFFNASSEFEQNAYINEIVSALLKLAPLFRIYIFEIRVFRGGGAF